MLRFPEGYQKQLKQARAAAMYPKTTPNIPDQHSWLLQWLFPSLPLLLSAAPQRIEKLCVFSGHSSARLL
jgi:hypothetical protein